MLVLITPIHFRQFFCGVVSVVLVLLLVDEEKVYQSVVLLDDVLVGLSR